MVLIPKNTIKMYELMNKNTFFYLKKCIKKILCENNDYDVYAQMNSRHKENILLLVDATT